MIRTVFGAALFAGSLLCSPLTLPVANAADVCAEFSGKVQPDGLCRVHVAEADYSMDMSFPVDFPDQSAVNEFLTQTRDGFVNVAQMPDSGAPYALDLKATQWSTETTRSVVFEVYQDLGGAHPSTWYESFNYDLPRERPIGFGDLFAPGAEAMTDIFPIVQQKLAAELGEPNPVLDSDGLDPAHYQNFAISTVDVVFFFDRGELMAGAAGAHTVHVPRSQIPPLAIG